MRYDAEHKQNTRRKLLKAAADAIRAEGPHRVAVAGVMAKAGLTHGGFYAHFGSKDELVVAAIGQMFEESRDRVLRETQDRRPRDGLIAYIDFYLSRMHRDAKEGGCPLAALACDLPRMDAAAREQFAVGMRELSATLADRLRQAGVTDSKLQGDSMLAELVGALSLARAEPDPKRSDALLAHSRRALKRRFNLSANAAEHGE
ncbi:MAG: TetR/AcrR family transcriptional regulator [Burkholderiales bacterium]|nr:TetR/AcrR family transcriptional regulator [Burkholderiales bacterium]MDE2608408.1 TetR/AcrR family transcriptional regulator [Burkholderiales bacterium]